MRKMIYGADDLTAELHALVHLCEWIDLQHDAELSAALPTLHGELHAEVNHLDATIGAWLPIIAAPQECDRAPSALAYPPRSCSCPRVRRLCPGRLIRRRPSC